MPYLSENSHIEVLAGDWQNFTDIPQQPFSSSSLRLLEALSRRLLGNSHVRAFPDVVAFAYWCRKANLQKEMVRCCSEHLRMGRGVALHFAPGNVPVNFAFSWAFGLLSGCTNVVRMPSKVYESADYVLHHIKGILTDNDFASEAQRNVFIRYPSSMQGLTEVLSTRADVRIIWGGDATVQTIRKISSAPRCVDITFADRYAFSVLNGAKIASLSPKALELLAENFYNDCYIMDQNACSSPHLVVWLGEKTVIQKAQDIFWLAVQGVVTKKYTLEPLHIMNKFVQSCHDAIDLKHAQLMTATKEIYRIKLQKLQYGLEERRGSGGYFYEYTTQHLEEVSCIVTRKYQTLTYFGVETTVLQDFVTQNSLKGIDRIVPVGKALDMGLIWDGIDTVAVLSRICQIV